MKDNILFVVSYLSNSRDFYCKCGGKRRSN